MPKPKNNLKQFDQENIFLVSDQKYYSFGLKANQTIREKRHGDSLIDVRWDLGNIHCF